MNNNESFKRIYIEISNICNLQCSFCPIVERDKAIMPPDLFKKILNEVSPFTKEICLHLMGEPLAHPEFLEILSICQENFKSTDVRINLTTNGILLNKYREILISTEAIRQINFSIHSFKDNFKDRDINPYLEDILNFSKESQTRRDDLYINYRLWNITSSNEQEESNLPLIQKMSAYFDAEIKSDIDVASIKSKRIYKKIYFHFDSRFIWPSIHHPPISDRGFCHGLTSHIGIHADGTVVPCCLDKEAIINLGDLKNIPLKEILLSQRAVAMKEGFRQKKLVEKLCKGCNYIQRFQ
jgi:radical SAM protein with 4Fe4S-binding SPASM domain